MAARMVIVRVTLSVSLLVLSMLLSVVIAQTVPSSDQTATATDQVAAQSPATSVSGNEDTATQPVTTTAAAKARLRDTWTG